jgi:hypothetical protein
VPWIGDSSPRAVLCRLRYEVRSILSVYPWPYLAVVRWKYRNSESKVVDRGSEVVIDGFPRSGNTFSIIAFELSQPRPVKITHHLHSAGQITRAIQWGLPTAVLVRDPEDAVLSHSVRAGCVTVRQGLRQWIRFYEKVLRYRDRVVVASFKDVTTDFGSVIRRINERFGTSFEVFEHTPENVERCFALIEDRNVQRYGSLVETHVARPSTERADWKGPLREELMDPSMKRMRTRARSLYRALVPDAG